MRTNYAVAVLVLVLSSAGCLSSYDGPCPSNGVRNRRTKACECPGVLIDGSVCILDADDDEPDGGMEEDLDAEPADVDIIEEPETGDAASVGDAAVDAEAAVDAVVLGDGGQDAGSLSDASSGDASDASDAQPARFWYRDCDGDGYAASRQGREAAAQKPPTPASCLDWTMLEPLAAGDIDCDDANEHRHPGAGPGLPLVAGSLPAAGSLAYDLDCDGTPEAMVDYVSTGVVRAGRLEVFGFCEAAPVCPEAKKCMVSFAFPETPLCGVTYDADVALDDVRCTQSIPVYFLCQ